MQGTAGCPGGRWGAGTRAPTSTSIDTSTVGCRRPKPAGRALSPGRATSWAGSSPGRPCRASSRACTACTSRRPRGRPAGREGGGEGCQPGWPARDRGAAAPGRGAPQTVLPHQACPHWLKATGRSEGHSPVLRRRARTAGSWQSAGCTGSTAGRARSSRRRRAGGTTGCGARKQAGGERGRGRRSV